MQHTEQGGGEAEAECQHFPLVPLWQLSRLRFQNLRSKMGLRTW